MTNTEKFKILCSNSSVEALENVRQIIIKNFDFCFTKAEVFENLRSLKIVEREILRRSKDVV